MKRTTLFLILVITLISIPSALAQVGTSEQEEVLKAAFKLAEHFFNGDIESAREFVHPDFISWGSAFPVPSDRETTDKHYKSSVELGAEFHAVEVMPLTIQVYDNFAILNAYFQGFMKAPGASPVMMATRWHSTWKKEGSKWLQIANYVDEGE